MKIDLLVEHPILARAVAQALFEQWMTPELSLQDRIAKVEDHLNRDRLPIAWVAHWERQLLGTAALRAYDLEGREDLTPWLGGMWVAPEHRGRGIGTALCSAVETKAAALGYGSLFLFTPDRHAWYAGRGWQSLEAAKWREEPGTIMWKRLVEL